MSARHALAILALIAVAAVPPAATAQSGLAPPGNAGIQEYQESLPSAEGDRPPGAAGGSGGGTPSSREDALDTTQEQQLAAQGADGRLTQRLTELTAPAAVSGSAAPDGTSGDTNAPSGSGGGASGGSAAPGGSDAAAGSGGDFAADSFSGSPISSIVDGGLLGGSGGMGLILPVLLLSATLVGVVTALRSRHTQR